MNSDSKNISDANDETRCDLCGQQKGGVTARRAITIGLNSGIVRWKFCNRCADIVTKWLNGEHAVEPPPKRTVAIALHRPLTQEEAEHVTRHLVEEAVERDLPSLLEKYRAAEKRFGRRVQVCITDYDETTYNFLHIGTEWTHGFWRNVNHATACRLRREGFLVRFVNLDLNGYMEWLARENLNDCSPAREQFAAAMADWEEGITSIAPLRRLEASAESTRHKSK